MRHDSVGSTLLTIDLGNDKFIAENPQKVMKFMRACKKATDYVLAEPEKALADYIDMKPIMGTTLNRKIFERSYAYFSKDLQNVNRDWVCPCKYSWAKSKFITNTS